MKKYFIYFYLILSVYSINMDNAVQHLIKHSHASSTGWCAKYVHDALEAGGFSLPRQASAYMYHSNGVLKNIGYKEIGKPSSNKKGDITVTERNSAHVDGHIAMWCGYQWISDFRQNSEYVYSSNQPPVHYYRYGSGGGSSPEKGVVFTYAVKINGGRILGEVKNDADYAGIPGKSIIGVAIKVNKGSVKYRVHVKGGNWLGYITGYNWKDSKNGYAGNGKAIDLVEIIYNGNKEKPLYRVSPLNSNYYSWQKGNKVGSGYDGYAGAKGKAIDRLQIKPN